MEQVFPSVDDESTSSQGGIVVFMVPDIYKCDDISPHCNVSKYEILQKILFFKFVWYYMILRKFHIKWEVCLSELVPNINFLVYVNELSHSNFLIIPT